MDSSLLDEKALSDYCDMFIDDDYYEEFDSGDNVRVHDHDWSDDYINRPTILPSKTQTPALKIEMQNFLAKTNVKLISEYEFVLFSTNLLSLIKSLFEDNLDIICFYKDVLLLFKNNSLNDFLKCFKQGSRVIVLFTKCHNLFSRLMIEVEIHFHKDIGDMSKVLWLLFEDLLREYRRFKEFENIKTKITIENRDCIAINSKNNGSLNECVSNMPCCFEIVQQIEYKGALSTINYNLNEKIIHNIDFELKDILMVNVPSIKHKQRKENKCKTKNNVYKSQMSKQGEHLTQVSKTTNKNNKNIKKHKKKK